MKCNECIHRVDGEEKDDNGGDLEARLRQTWTNKIDYCDHHCLPCYDAYLRCEYRDLEVTAEDIQFIINLLNSDMKEKAIKELEILLEG